MIKNIISVLIAISSIALSNTSLADQYNWSGVTLGGGLGVAQMKSTIENRNVDYQHYFTSYGDAVNFQSSPASGFAHISLGIQKQYSNFLIGFDLDHSLSSFEQSRRQIGLFDTNDYEAKINNITSLSGKFGYAFDNNLIYGKLGYATAKISTQSTEPLFAHIGTSSNRQSAFLVGVGYDKALTENVILGINYNHYSFNDKTQTGQDLSGYIPIYLVNIGPSLDAVMFKLSYKFNPSPN